MRHLYTTLTCLLVAAMLLLPEVAKGQYRFNFSDSLGTYKVAFRPHNPEQFSSRSLNIPVKAGVHEIRLGTAYCAYTPSDYTTSSYWYPVDYWQQLGENYSTGDERWFTIGLEGGRWFREWFYLGGSLIWSGGFIPVRYTPTHQRVSTFTSTNISIMPIVRFAWLRRGIVQLYSGVGLGFAVGYNEKIDYNDTLFDVAYDVTFIGLSIGRDIFGYIDIGVGNRGVISAGIGYRFNN